MKRIISLFLLFSCLIFNVGCKTLSPTTYSLNEYIASCLSKISNIENFNNETIKVLSIIYRTNYSDNEIKNVGQINPKILQLTSETDNQILNSKLILNTSSENWSEIISNSEILEYFKSQNIYLSNLSQINILSNNDLFAQSISIASKKQNFYDFASYFNLPSNKKINIKQNKSNLIIEGYGNTFNYDIDISTIEMLANEGLNYKEIIKNII